jgi:hypothetical protein
MRSILCSIAQSGGRLGGKSLGKTSAYSCKRFATAGEISKDGASSRETSTLEHTSKTGASKTARVASKTGAFNLISDLSEVDGDDSYSLAVLTAIARSSLTICTSVIGCIIIFCPLNMRE